MLIKEDRVRGQLEELITGMSRVLPRMKTQFTQQFSWKPWGEWSISSQFSTL